MKYYAKFVPNTLSITWHLSAYGFHSVHFYIVHAAHKSNKTNCTKQYSLMHMLWPLTMKYRQTLSATFEFRTEGIYDRVYLHFVVVHCKINFKHISMIGTLCSHSLSFLSIRIILRGSCRYTRSEYQTLLTFYSQLK